MTTQKVVGISFGPEVSAPTVVLKAAGDDAATLLSRARSEAGVQTVRMPELANQLYRTPIDAPVDRALFPVMATLLVHIMKSDRLQRESKS